ncbi:MAG: T9SS type A sorting domain-containing protein [Flavobacteriales bacterium]|nr:T9SS type A sorting domain-containing protein [Flavobacteriales bacterium]
MIAVLAVGTLFLNVPNASGQSGLVLKPLEYNPAIKTFLKANPHYEWGAGTLDKWGQADTLELPFFEDFTAESVYPDSSLFADNQVFVNRNFGVKPPSFGVATFDFLDPTGSPYRTLQKDLRGGGDTLTSQYIDLTQKAGQGLSPADSLYFSFFYQARGLGDYIKPLDSLILEFFDRDGNWIRVWDRAGTGFTVFDPVMIRLDSARYFHNAFRFRFRNWTHYWGNNNHWHIDHIYLDSKRKGGVLSTDDYTIQTPPSSMLRRYASMPLDHFLVDPAAEQADSSIVRIANLNSSPITALARNEYFVKGNLIGSTNLSDNSGVLGAFNNTERILPLPDLSGQFGFPLVVDRYYYVKESGRTNPAPFTRNDAIHSTQVFDRYFAYDDGSAETGFGFNDLAGKIGQVAVRFELNKPDTLRGVGFYFTHNISVVGDVRYDIQVWRSIARPGSEDDLAYELSVRGAYHTGEINGYHYFIFPEPVILDAGDFYVGWSQGEDFNLAVGFDKNGGNLFEGLSINKDLYYNVGEGWNLNNSGDLIGAPMIRPLVGPEVPYTASVLEQKAVASKSFLYPNPSKGLVYIKEKAGIKTEAALVYGSDGRFVGEFPVRSSVLDLGALASGTYMIGLRTDVTERTWQWIVIE